MAADPAGRLRAAYTAVVERLVELERAQQHRVERRTVAAQVGGPRRIGPPIGVAPSSRIVPAA